MKTTTWSAPIQSLDTLAARFDVRSPGALGHSHRVARMSACTARQLGLPRERVALVRRAAALHDIGKIRTPAQILNKPGPLSEAEFAVVREHAAAGGQMTAASGGQTMASIVRHHHERFDGAGYPDGLAGGEIPLGARIVAVADTFDALTSARPYRPAMSHTEALALLRGLAGTQLDPAVVDAFLRRYR